MEGTPREHHLAHGAKAAVPGGESLFNWGKSTAGQSAQSIHLSPFLEAHVEIVVTITNKILRKVDQLVALCNQLKERLVNAQEIQLNLADSLVEQAIN